MDDSAEIRRLLAELSDRLGKLEALATGPTAPGSSPRQPPPTTATDDVFWALNALKARVPHPGGVVYAGAVATVAGPVEWQIGYTTDQLLESDWTTLAPSISALGHPVRLSLLHAIISGVTTVAELGAGEGMGTTGQLYHHLSQLVAAGWLLAGGRGHYSVPPERVVPLLIILSAARRVL
ncbi:MAG TPA: winged helix-turn-helix domain-containing protein [Glaciihabitans sp.]|jgi:hypothetical protein|nr:winged helix-turn-helix domain-containing protein [Glaciihabitans sp.]